MKKVLYLFLIIILIIPLASCSYFRKSILDVSNEDLKNAETARTVAKNFLSTWSLNSGVIRGALGTSINQLPAESVDAMNSLDELATNTNLTDSDLGMAMGLVVRIYSRVVLEVIKQYAPNVLQYLPAILGVSG